jgi:type II secretory pathway pseudopilin PulG
MVKMKKSLPDSRRGFTLMELLIVMSILIFLIISILLALRSQIIKGNDMTRKTDLGKIQKVLEEYYNDKKTYPAMPPTSPIANCGSADLKPYLDKVPCDPTKKTPYYYVSDIAGILTPENGYVLCTKLENLSDPDIPRIGCHPVNGCGWAVGYNYCITSGATPVLPGFNPSEGTGGLVTPTPIPSPTPPWGGQYACSPGGDCNNYGDPVGAGCPFTYDSPYCVYNSINQCSNPANRCSR